MMAPLDRELAELLGLSCVYITDPTVSLQASLPTFLGLVRLVACFANRPFSCSEALQDLIPAACKGEGITLDDDLRLQWTRFTNVLRVKGCNLDALLIPQNLGQQFPLLTLLFVRRGADIAYLCMPFGTHPNIAAVPIARQFSRLIPSGPSGLDQIFKDTAIPDHCNLLVPSNLHFGHYVLNSLGPAVQALAVVRAAGAAIQLLRIENGFLTLEQEAWLLDPTPPPSPWIKTFPSIQAARYSAKESHHALLELYGSSIDLMLAFTTQRLIKQCPDLAAGALARGWQRPEPDELILGISLRGGTREAVNLIEVVRLLFQNLLRRGRRVFVVIDGIAASPNNKVSTTANLSQDKEEALAKNILDAAIEVGGRGISVVGWPLMDQLVGLSHCDVVIGHEGSSSAKSMWMLGLKTLIHAPSPPVTPKPRRPELQPVGLQFRHAYRGGIHPIEIRFPHDLVSLLPTSNHGREDRQRRNYRLAVKRAVTFIEDSLSSLSLLEPRL